MAKGSLIVAGLLVVSSTCASAQTWQRETDKLLNIQLGTELGAIAECPKEYGEHLDSFSPRLKEAAGSEPCWARNSPREILRRGARLYEVRNIQTPEGFAPFVGVEVDGGKVVELELLFGSSSFSTMRLAAVDRYGAPSEESSEALQDGRGRLATARLARWMGKDAMLSLAEQRSGPPGFGYLTLTSSRYVQALVQKRSDAAKKISGAL